MRQETLKGEAWEPLEQETQEPLEQEAWEPLKQETLEQLEMVLRADTSGTTRALP